MTPKSMSLWPWPYPLHYNNHFGTVFAAGGDICVSQIQNRNITVTWSELNVYLFIYCHIFIWTNWDEFYSINNNDIIQNVMGKIKN